MTKQNYSPVEFLDAVEKLFLGSLEGIPAAEFRWHNNRHERWESMDYLQLNWDSHIYIPRLRDQGKGSPTDIKWGVRTRSRIVYPEIDNITDIPFTHGNITAFVHVQGKTDRGYGTIANYEGTIPLVAKPRFHTIQRVEPKAEQILSMSELDEVVRDCLELAKFTQPHSV